MGEDPEGLFSGWSHTIFFVPKCGIGALTGPSKDAILSRMSPLADALRLVLWANILIWGALLALAATHGVLSALLWLTRALKRGRVR